MKLTRVLRCAEFGMNFLVGAAITIGGLVISTASAANIISLTKTSK